MLELNEETPVNASEKTNEAFMSLKETLDQWEPNSKNKSLECVYCDFEASEKYIMEVHHFSQHDNEQYKSEWYEEGTSDHNKSQNMGGEFDGLTFSAIRDDYVSELRVETLVRKIIDYRESKNEKIEELEGKLEDVREERERYWEGWQEAQEDLAKLGSTVGNLREQIEEAIEFIHIRKHPEFSDFQDEVIDILLGEDESVQEILSEDSDEGDGEYWKDRALNAESELEEARELLKLHKKHKQSGDGYLDELGEVLSEDSDEGDGCGE